MYQKPMKITVSAEQNISCTPTNCMVVGKYEIVIRIRDYISRIIINKFTAGNLFVVNILKPVVAMENKMRTTS